MVRNRISILVVALILIGGVIYYLESQKVDQVDRDSSGDELRIEDIVSNEYVESNDQAISDESPETPETVDEPSGADTPSNQKTENDVAHDTSEPVALTKTRSQVIAEKATRYERAKEISTPDGFINTESFKLADLIGKKVILLDIWTYSCINCQRTLPYLNSWHEEYADDGLVIVGLHTPEFEFEKEYDNVKQATEKWGVEYPVVLDNDYSTWHAYNNRYWPRKYLIDIDGFIVYDHIGEGSYDETERRIVEALNERSEVLGMQAVALDTAAPEDIDTVDFTKIKTRESYFGSSRIEYLANLPDTSCYGNICDFEAPGQVPTNFFALDGEWQIREEEATLKDSSGSIISQFSAGKVNLVAGADEPVTATIYLDGEIIPDMYAGSAVENGVVTFEEHDLYNLVDLNGMYGEHTLEIRFDDGDISAFAFTFG